ncbi:MAG: four helix bundle protein [Vicinamibacterales bacterium]
MAAAKDIRELGAWRLAHELKQRADEICARPRVTRDFDFRDQLRDAAASAPRNIAEGFGRFRHKEFAQFVRVAKASEVEVLNHFIDARDRGYVSGDELPPLERAVRKALKGHPWHLWHPWHLC